MGLIQFDQRRSEQPSGKARLRDKWASFSTLSERGITVLGDITKDVSIGGRGWQGNGSTKGAYANASLSINGTGSGNDSLAIGGLFSLNSATGDGTLFGLGVSTNTTGGFFQVIHSGGVLLLGIDDAANASGANCAAASGYADGLVHTAVALLRTTPTLRYQELFVDGRLVAFTDASGYNATTYDRACVGCLRRSATSGFVPAGRFVYEAFFARGIGYEEARIASARGWDAFYTPKRIWVPVGAGGGDVSLALSGATTTAATGNTAASITTALTGVSSTATAGTVGATTGATAALTGVNATTATGTLAASISAALTGVSSTTAAGTLAAATSAALTGVSSTAATGTLGFTVAATRALTGVSATAATGTLSAGGDVAISVTGQAASTAQGTVGITASGSAALSGVSSTAATGSLTAAISKALSGASATVSAGSLTAGGDVSVTIAGQAVSTAQGTVGVTATGAVTVALTGAAAVIAAGDIFVTAPVVGWSPVDDSSAALWTDASDSDPNAWIPVDDSNAALGT